MHTYIRLYTSIKPALILLVQKDNERKKEYMIIKGKHRKNMHILKVTYHLEYNADQLKLDCVYQKNRRKIVSNRVFCQLFTNFLSNNQKF